MSKSKRFGLAALALGGMALTLGLGATSAAQAEMMRGRRALTVHHRYVPSETYADLPLAAPIAVPLGAGVLFQTPFFAVASPYGPNEIVRVPHYQGPDGTYDDLGDLSSDIQGTPCGRACTARSLARWGYVQAD